MLSFSIPIIIGLFLTATGASVVSAVTGMAGGILLFSFMTMFMTLEAIIPLHGLCQLGSNTSRIYYLRGHMIKEMILFFSVGALIGAGSATWLKSSLIVNPKYPLSGVVLLILYVLFRPKKLPSLAVSKKSFFWVGLVGGFLGIFIGTIGPFLAAFFVRDDLTKEQIISNKAIMQAFVHLTKIPAYLVLGFDYTSILPLAGLMVLGAVIGSKIGVGILKKIDYSIFVLLFRSCLFLGACRLSYKVIFE